MAPRRRKRENRDLPDNLYSNAKGYYYRHPLTRKNFGMGTDRTEAIKAAKILNQRIVRGNEALVARVIGSDTIRSVIQQFREEYLPEKKLAARTLSETEYRLLRYEREFGALPFEQFDLAALSTWLKPLTREAYIKHRQQWIEIFRYACSVGVSDRNIAELTLKKAPGERVRQRWTLEQFKAARDLADPWLRAAMALAVTSLQRREDLVNMRFDHIENDRLKVRQHKTGERIAIKLGGTLEAAIREARERSIICPFIIARKPEKMRKGTKEHAFQVLPDYLTKAVAEIRDRTGLFDEYEEGERPTLHELRSLGAHLYREAGYAESYIQALLGHADGAMTKHYLDGHKEEWLEVSADLKVEL